MIFTGVLQVLGSVAVEPRAVTPSSSIHPETVSPAASTARLGPDPSVLNAMGASQAPLRWAKSRRDYWVIKRKTARKRLRRASVALWQWCRQNRHLPLKDQYRILCSKLRGHYQCYGLRGNYRMMDLVMESAKRAWWYWLSRRSQKSTIPWTEYERLLEKLPLPRPRIVHSI